MTQVEIESYTIKGGIRVVERFFNVPLDYDKPQGKGIRIYARNLVPLEKTKEPPEQSKLPYFVYLQGGPGFEVELQSSLELASIIHAQGYQTLWLDPRGTGLSTPVSAELMTKMTDEEKVQYLKNFRADNIVRDCEFIRNALLGDNKNPEDRKWTILGQSYGGFCSNWVLDIMYNRSTVDLLFYSDLAFAISNIRSWRAALLAVVDVCWLGVAYHEILMYLRSYELRIELCTCY